MRFILSYFLALVSLNSIAQTHEPCVIDPHDSMSSYTLSASVPGLNGYKIIKAQLAASPGIMSPCRIRMNDSTAVNTFVKEFTFEVIRDGKTVSKKSFQKFNDDDFRKTVNILDSGDICRFKNIQIGVPYGYHLPGKEYKVTELEYLIVSKDVYWDSATTRFVRHISGLPEVNRLYGLYDGHVHICRSAAGGGPNRSDSKDVITTYMELLSCSADGDGDEYELDYKWTFIYDRKTEDVRVRDELNNRVYSLKQWKRLSLKIR